MTPGERERFLRDAAGVIDLVEFAQRDDFDGFCIWVSTTTFTARQAWLQQRMTAHLVAQAADARGLTFDEALRAIAVEVMEATELSEE